MKHPIVMYNQHKQHKNGTCVAEPPDIPITDIRYSLVDVSTSVSTPEMRERVLQEFCKREKLVCNECL